MPDKIAFNVPRESGLEQKYLLDVLSSSTWAGDGRYSKACVQQICGDVGVPYGLITHSCTAALEMAALLAALTPGDEVIMPSFTFVSTANAVVLRRAVPVYVDIRPDTLNIDENLIEAAITPRTKAICVVHYAGVCAEMDAICEVAARHGLIVIEDAAQAHLSTYHGRPAGRLGVLGCFSFHETKNITAGEGGALTVNDPSLSERAYVIWEKGTNRQALKLGLVDKYTWMDIGSSFLPSEFMAAILFAQLEQMERFTRERCAIWSRYHHGFADLEAAEVVRRPTVPAHCNHNGHLYYLLLRNQEERDLLIKRMQAV